MRIPDWWAFALLALAAWRVFQLVAHDDILDRPRRYITRLGNEWQKEGDDVPSGYRKALGDWLLCPYCAGFWIAGLWWLSYQIWPHATVIAAVPFALSAALVGIAKILGSEA